MKPIPPSQLKEAIEWINTYIDRYMILVFCNAGVGRGAPSVVIGYLCCYKHYRFDDAMVFVAKRKPHISTLPDLQRTINAVMSLIY